MTVSWDATGLLEKHWGRVGGRDKLAALTGVSGSNLSSYNTGARKLGMKVAQRIADALDVTVYDLGAPEAVEEPASATILTRLAQLEGQGARQARTIRDLAQRLRTAESQLEAAQPPPGTLPQEPGGQP